VTHSDSPALQTARSYFEAFAAKDLDALMSYVADDIVCRAPAGRVEGADAYRAFIGPYMEILLDARLIAAFGDDDTAVIMYDTDSIPVKGAPAAEGLTVRDGKIVHSWFIFDRAPFDAARRAAAAA
jgi:ketosteroid isomerase-like protein